MSLYHYLNAKFWGGGGEILGKLLSVIIIIKGLLYNGVYSTAQNNVLIHLTCYLVTMPRGDEMANSTSYFFHEPNSELFNILFS